MQYVVVQASDRSGLKVIWYQKMRSEANDACSGVMSHLYTKVRLWQVLLDPQRGVK